MGHIFYMPNHQTMFKDDLEAPQSNPFGADPGNPELQGDLSLHQHETQDPSDHLQELSQPQDSIPNPQTPEREEDPHKDEPSFWAQGRQLTFSDNSDCITTYFK